MNICIVGAGYVGLTTAAVFADIGHTVYCTDRDSAKIDKLKQGIVPIYEPGLTEMIDKNQAEGRLFFAANVRRHMRNCPVIVIAVGTPSAKNGSADMKYILNVIKDLSLVIRSPKTIIMKSTVPPGTADWVDELLLEYGVSSDIYELVSNPEFLREGSAIEDTIHPDRIIIGANKEGAAMRVKELYHPIDTRFLLTHRVEAELIKYASNAFLATKISFINEISRVCDAFKADITEVAKGIGMDNRIGPKFLQAGLGYGGSCFPKDVNALSYAASTKQVKMDLLQAVKKINRSQLNIYLNKLNHKLGESRDNVRIAVWGATFKENTDDTRYSQAIAFMKILTKQGYQVYAYDPLVSPPIPSVIWCSDKYEAVKEADALVIATVWPEFIEADWGRVKQLMKRNIILDGRNGLDKKMMKAYGFEFTGVGRP
ncbi:UDP-glucose/GDP-mannose dehydrogenase family protein [Paenibacillus alkaliterrae]|uniref:UDP-glucose dehydrogenase family protein n=1 Tax=Paenibacillus alkaliterrae TaxID=320909 RepID=UPI001F36E320|nr:UDP-glucose/GDP-mannose dehydrogenase family protein [Paenibacillus alkaliterrae]MCF2939558.1 UDP-glucose/GDP-mannose dehydrogenase family protein [Paenibacillus alkaliterrae]